MPAATKKPAGTLDEARAKLRAPYTPAAVKWKIQTNPKQRRDGSWSKAQAVPFIDARLVAERLSEVVGGGWETSFHPPLGPTAVVCKLTVLGVSREDIGTGEGGNDDIRLKGMYSDAFKRAAVQFGIGAFLYAMPKQWVDPGALRSYTNQRGETKFSLDNSPAERFLRQGYEQWVKREDVVKLFGQPIDHGDVLGDDEPEVPEPLPAPSPQQEGPARSLDDEWVGLVREAYKKSGWTEKQLGDAITELGVPRFPVLRVRIQALSIAAAEVLLARLEDAYAEADGKLPLGATEQSRGDLAAIQGE